MDDGIGVAPSCSPAAGTTVSSSLGVELPLPLIMQNRRWGMARVDGVNVCHVQRCVVQGEEQCLGLGLPIQLQRQVRNQIAKLIYFTLRGIS